MFLGVLAGYGLGLRHFFAYLIPLNRKSKPREMFVGTLATMAVGESLRVTIPQGQSINIVRLSDDSEKPERGFKALSSTCPHLGCKVHWEEGKNRFFCPCHHGVFDREGSALEGPPAREGKNLPTYEVRVNSKNGWVFVLVPGEAICG
jgi:Rieske Fe-S protein